MIGRKRSSLVIQQLTAQNSGLANKNRYGGSLIDWGREGSSLAIQQLTAQNSSLATKTGTEVH